MRKTNYYLVDEAAMPPVFLKVLEAKRALQHGRAKTVGQAVAAVGISRSAFYKYKDLLAPFSEMRKEQIITIQAVVRDEPGVLSGLINHIASSGANILTINQSIPVHGTAGISVSLQVGALRTTEEALLEDLQQQTGMIRLDVLARE